VRALCGERSLLLVDAANVVVEEWSLDARPLCLGKGSDTQHLVVLDALGHVTTWAAGRLNNDGPDLL
jgi:hypothetical protein